METFVREHLVPQLMLLITQPRNSIIDLYKPQLASIRFLFPFPSFFPRGVGPILQVGEDDPPPPPLP